MKSLQSFLEAATEAQIRAQNPNASPEMVRRAAERSARSEAQRTGNQATRNQQSSAIVKREPNAPTKEKGGALAKTTSTSMTKTEPIKKAEVKVEPRSADSNFTNRNAYSPSKEPTTKSKIKPSKPKKDKTKPSFTRGLKKGLGVPSDREDLGKRVGKAAVSAAGRGYTAGQKQQGGDGKEVGSISGGSRTRTFGSSEG